MCNQQQTNTQSSFPPVFSSSPSVLGPPIFNRKRGKKNKQTEQQKKQAENKAKKNFKIHTLPSHTSSGDGAMG
jgi:hypothetical protein